MKKIKVLDCFCGLGGWSSGFNNDVFEVIGIDIINVGYPGEIIIKDMRLIQGEDFRGFDIIIGSPPCRDFTKLAKSGGVGRWKVKPDIKSSLDLVNCFLRFIVNANPKYWIMENNPILQEYIGTARTVTYFTPYMRRALWGNYPGFLVPMENRVSMGKMNGRLRSWDRAKIPKCVSSSLANALMQE